MELSNEVKKDIREFLELNWDDFTESAKLIDDDVEERDFDEVFGLQITFATNDDGDIWSYQTGDNSYTGGCYSFPHWAVTEIYASSEVEEITEEIIGQLEEIEIFDFESSPVYAN